MNDGQNALEERQLHLEAVLVGVRAVVDDDARHGDEHARASASTGTSPSGVRNASTRREREAVDRDAVRGAEQHDTRDRRPGRAASARTRCAAIGPEYT